MHTITNAPRHIRFYGAALAMAAALLALLAIVMFAVPAQAAPDTNPKPCGPGAQDPPDNPDATITKGHYAVFDGYWSSENKTLELNLCPPSVVHSMESGGRGKPDVEVSTRTKSNVDIRRTVIHIDHIDGIPTNKQFKHVLTAADLDKYDFFKKGDSNRDGHDDAVGQTVWWLKVDDESTPNVDEDSPLAMGFSAALFDSKHWQRREGGAEVAPLQYEFEVIREPGIPVDEQGHVYAFDDSVPAIGQDKTPFWDSNEVDANALRLYPGEYKHLQWVFTRAGTYVVSVQLKGHVRKTNPHSPGEEGYDKNWEPISSKEVETSEVRQYVFQVGTLTLNEDPVFEVERSVKETAAGGSAVGDPIPVYRGDDDDLTFTLDGPGHSLFSVDTTGGGAQISVKGELDHEARSEYRLTLGVSDGKDREGHTDDSIDSTVSVKINVLDVETFSVALSNPNPSVGDSVAITVTLTDPPAGMNRSTLSMYLVEIGAGTVYVPVNRETLQGTATVTKNSAQTVVYRPHTDVWVADPSISGGGRTEYLSGHDFTITWQANQ